MEKQPMTILISITSPPMIGAFGNIIRSHAIAVEARRRGIRVAWMMGQNYKHQVLKVLDTMLKKSSESERQYHDYSQDLFYYLKTLPVLGSILPEWLSHQLTLNGTRKFEGEIPSFLPYLLGERTFGNFYMVLMAMGFVNGSILRKLLKEQLKIIQLTSPFVIIKEIEPTTLIASHLSNCPIMETISSPMLKGRHSSFASNFVNSAVSSVLEEFLEGNEKLFPSVASYDDLSFANRNLKIIFSIPELETPLVNEKPNNSYVGMANIPEFLPTHSNLNEKLEALQRKREELLKSYPNQRVLFFYFGKGSISFESVEREIPKFCQMLNEKLKNPDGKEYHCYIASSHAERPYTLLQYSHFDSWFNGDDMTMISELTFNHGGANSVMQSIYYGVPQVVCAGYMFERVFNGLSTEIGKNGILLNPDEFSHKILFEKLFSNNSFTFNQLKENTKIAQKKLVDRGGAHQLFSDMEIWLNRSLTFSEEWQEEITKRNEMISKKLVPKINSILQRDATLQKSFIGQLSLWIRDVGIVIPCILFTIFIFPFIFSILIFKFISLLCFCCCRYSK